MREQIQAESNALHQLLSGSDYYATQIIESLVSTMQGATAINFIGKFISWLANANATYGDIIRKRATWRKSLKELELLLEAMDEESSNESE